MLKKIVIIGPESTGKSMLCELLAQHYKTTWVPEFAREYLLTNEINYTYDDLVIIAKGQLALEDEYIKMASIHSPLTSHLSSRAEGGTPLFIDTNMYVMKVWCEFVFNNCHKYILEQIVERKYDLYLLCNIDLPWIADPLREYPDLRRRQQLYAIYKDIMINQDVPWVEISGNYEERLQRAIKATDSILHE